VFVVCFGVCVCGFCLWCVVCVCVQLFVLGVCGGLCVLVVCGVGGFAGLYGVCVLFGVSVCV